MLGGAGSGKTTIALWAAREWLLRPDGDPVERVLFLTFSRTAVRELVKRSRTILSRLRDRIEIQTFHSLCHRLVDAFGGCIGFRARPSIQSEAERKLFGGREGAIRYDDLVPLALKLLATKRVARLVRRRWSLVICDEFQDTDDGQWSLLRQLSSAGRLYLMADPNQMIYTFLRNRGVGEGRLREARALVDRELDLGTPSHRDPSNVIPAYAAVIREREFDDDAVALGVAQDRLRVLGPVDDNALVDTILTEVAAARADGARSVGIFGHSNQSVANLSAELTSEGLTHDLIGLPEAHGEAIASLVLLTRFGLGLAAEEEVLRQLGIFATAISRGREAPPLAKMLAGLDARPRALNANLERAWDALREAGRNGFDELIELAASVWPRLATPGHRPWTQAARTFVALAHRVALHASDDAHRFVEALERRSDRLRTETLLDQELPGSRTVQVMNFHQTKGREADVVILVYRDSDYFGKERDPFPDASRLLYVSLSRASLRNVVVLPDDPHPLVRPFRGHSAT